MTVEIEPAFKRTQLPLLDTQPFFPRARDYHRQYAGMYWFRLEALRPHVLAAARSKWPGVSQVAKIFDMSGDEECCIVGTVFVAAAGKPNVLVDLADDVDLHSVKLPSKYIGEKEVPVVTIEDHSGRVRLSGSILQKSCLLPTGVVVAVRGREVPGGLFEVSDFVFPQAPVQKPPRQVITGGDQRFVAFCCGLRFNSQSDDIATDVLADFLSGQLGREDVAAFAAKISRLVIVGNSTEYEPPSEVKTWIKNREGQNDKNQELLLEKFKRFIVQTSPFIDIDLMPGQSDPCSQAFPQRPMHKALINPTSANVTTVNCHTNPTQFELDGVSFLGTSGQNIDDIMRYSSDATPIDAAEATLKWRHIAPTAPDTLYCYPFNGGDPFIVDSLPHVYFVGNQPKFETRLFHAENGAQTTIIMVPSFAETGSLVLLDMSSNAVSVLNIVKK